MASYTYTARKLSGEKVTGTLAADTERGALDILSQMRLFPVSVNEAVEQRKRRSWQIRPGRVKGRELVAFYRQLSDLLRAGVPLMRAMNVLKRQTANARLAEVISQISDDVARGTDLTSAMARFPKVFSTLAVSMVRAGEQGGFLEDVLARVAVFAEKADELKSRVLSALAYPILLVVVGAVAVVALVTVLVPRFEPMFQGLGTRLPLPTRMLLGLSAALSGTWYILLAVLVFGIAALYRYVRTPGGRLWLDRLRLRLPAVGAVYKGLAISRFTRTLGTLLASGVPILQSLRIARDAANNLVFAGEIDRAAAGVKEGLGLGNQLGHHGPFDPIVVDMIAVGEESGNLDQVLVNIADTYERRVDRAVRTMVTLLEPLMLLIVASLIGFIVLAMLLPVFTMTAQLG